MKQLLTLCLLMLFSSGLFAQTDTIYTKAKKKIPCKIIEIGEEEIRYKTIDNLDGPAYVINASNVLKYRLSTGTEATIRPDERLLENQHQEIMNNRSVIKVHPFSFVNNQISLAYEQVIKMGTSLDVELGYINNGISPSTAGYQFTSPDGKPADKTGFYIKPGVKFLVGQDYSLKGMKYAHPLKGRFIRLDAVFSYLNYNEVANNTNMSQQGPFWPSQTYTITYNSQINDVNVFSYGLMINYGRQFLLGNIITLEYYVGVGATALSSSTSNLSNETVTYIYDPNNPNWQSYPYYGYYNQDASYVNNFHGYFRMPNVGLSGTFGLRLGFILPEKKIDPSNSQN